MLEDKKKLAIRFVGFDDAWEQRKIDKLLTEVIRPVKMMDDKEYELVTVKRRNEGVTSRGKLKGIDILVKTYFEVKAGDYLISKRQVVHGANGIVPKSLDGAVVSNEYLVLTDNDGMSVEFLAILSKHPEMYKKFFLSSYGIDIEKLVFDVDDWKKRTINIPTIAEQKRICLFFKTIETLITLHQRKYDKLVAVKKSMLEKMFPKNGSDIPELRFAGFTDPWEQRKVENIAERFYGGGTPSTLNSQFWMGDIPWIQSSDLTGDELFDVVPRKHISSQAIAASATKVVPKDSIAVITRVGVGKLAFMPYTYTSSQDFLSLSGLKMDGIFTTYALYKKLQSELHIVQGTSIKGITKEELLAKVIMAPNQIAEQRQLGVFFQSLDHLITLHQRKLEKLKNVKKAMLDKMFV